MTNKKWIKEIDIIRAFSIILIVICHLHYFINLGNLQPLLLVLSSYLAILGLGLFFFISGFSLYYNYPSINSFTELKHFWKKRALRIYPLYIFAIIFFVIWSFYYYGDINVDGTIVGYQMISIFILGLQGILITTTQGVLFWFIGVLLIYYLFYPLIMKVTNMFNFISFALFLFVIMYIFHINLNLININFFNYYATFILGILICWIDYNSSKIYLKDTFYGIILLIPTSVVLIFSLYISFSLSLNVILLSLITCLISYYSIKKLTHILDKLYPFISKISISSYPVFLLHYTLLSIIEAILLKLDLNSNLIVLLILLALPFIFYLCYYIQIFEYKSIKSLNLISLKTKLIKKMISKFDIF